MKKFNKLALAVGVAGGLLAVPAMAVPISLDVRADGDGAFALGDADTRTDTFNQLTLDGFNPTSVYYDIDNSGGVSTGDIVIDAAITTVLGLNGLDGTSTEALGLAWGVDVSWVLEGTATVLNFDPDPNYNGLGTDALVGEFNGGEVALTCTGSCAGDEIVIDVTGSSVSDPFSGDIEIEVFGEVADVTAGFARFEAGTRAGEDFADIVLDPLDTIRVRGNSELEGGATVPAALDDGESVFDWLDARYDTSIATALDGLIADFELRTFGEGTVADRYLRTTFLNSANIQFDVPAPATLGLLGLGLLGLGARARKQRS
ncbi:PEP-CTERM sorting domain-containing protein [Congregibacter litoralis]|uniref:PEP-CTERM protein sorting domain protein n=1 Tax=Congregibacter litoralis KT71 TaxID=314285 RepID=A4A576_9GAMM|nr:PEP-CTERM sorting domain-containing protein [Congregibacter litoralis]EAQ98947.2 PEP-CTERM protein sorting domain protein [Congregibacter litoralis KT71]